MLLLFFSHRCVVSVCAHTHILPGTPRSPWGQFSKTFTPVIYKCSYCFQPLETVATLVNFTCKSFFKLTPVCVFNLFNQFWLVLSVNPFPSHLFSLTEHRHNNFILGGREGGRGLSPTSRRCQIWVSLK